MGEGPASSFFRRCGCQGRCSALPAAVCFQNDKRGCDFPDSLRKVTLKTICRARKPPFRNCVTPSLFALSAPKYQHRHRTRQRPSERRGFSSDKKPERAAPTARGAVPASLLLVVATSHQPLAPASILSSSSRQSAATRISLRLSISLWVRNPPRLFGGRGFQPPTKSRRAAPTARGAVPASLLLVVATNH